MCTRAGGKFSLCLSWFDKIASEATKILFKVASKAQKASKELNKLFPRVSELQAGIVDGDLPQKSNLFGVITAPCLCLEKSLVADGTLPPLRKHGCQPLGTAALIIALHPRVSAIWPLCVLCCVLCTVYCVCPCVIYIHPLCAVYRVNVSYVHPCRDPCLLELAACVWWRIRGVKTLELKLGS